MPNATASKRSTGRKPVTATVTVSQPSTLKGIALSVSATLTRKKKQGKSAPGGIRG